MHEDLDGNLPMTRDQRRSLWLNAAVAGKLATDPGAVIARAQANLTQLREIHPHGTAARWLAQWQLLLDGPVEEVLLALTSPSQRSRELRQNSPFAGVLDAEGATVLAAFRANDRSRATRTGTDPT